MESTEVSGHGYKSDLKGLRLAFAALWTAEPLKWGIGKSKDAWPTWNKHKDGQIGKNPDRKKTV